MKFIPTKNQLKPIAAYLALGAVVFSIGLLWNFPYESFREKLNQFVARTTHYQIDMDKLSPALPIGAVATHARIQGPPVMGTEPLQMEFDRLRVTASLFSPFTYLFKKTFTLHFSADQEKTRWSGYASFGKEILDVALSTSSFKWKHAFAIPDWGEVVGQGTVALESQLKGKNADLQVGNLTSSNGALTLNLTNGIVNTPLLKRELHFDKIDANAKLDQSRISVTTLNLSGPDLTGTATGTIMVAPYFPRSQFDLDVNLVISDKSPELKSVLVTVATGMGLHVSETGQIKGKLTGSIERPVFTGN